MDPRAHIYLFKCIFLKYMTNIANINDCHFENVEWRQLAHKYNFKSSAYNRRLKSPAILHND